MKWILKIYLLWSLLTVPLSSGSICLETKIQAQTQQAMHMQETAKNLEMPPCYGKIPVYFIPNEGQVDTQALFYARASRYTIWVTKDGLVFDSIKRMKKTDHKLRFPYPRDREIQENFDCKRDISRLIFLNSNKNSAVIPVDRTEHRVNCFLGNDESKWQTNIQTSRGVLCTELYRNVNLKVYGTERQIEYDFLVKPGGKVSDISFKYENVENSHVDKEGNLVIETEFGALVHSKPACYQVIKGERTEVESEFQKIENNIYGFKVKEYNKNHELIIDPLVLVYSSYLGGSDDDTARSIAVDSGGAVYITGWTWSADFPTQNPIQDSKIWWRDVIITKVNSSGSALVYSTYLGGSDDESLLRGDYGRSIAVDSEGAVYITGDTFSADFPTKNPIQGTHGGGDCDAFITKLNSTGDSLVYSTYLGGSGSEIGYGIALDSTGAAHVTGETSSDDFPTQNPIQESKAGGTDVFITKINVPGNTLVYSTYLGGSDNEIGYGIAVGSKGAAYVTGETSSDDFPTQYPIQGSRAGGTDLFITKVSASGDELIYSTYLGGSSVSYYSNEDIGRDIAVDSEGAAYVTGETSSTDFPTLSAIYKTYGGGWDDAFITKINSLGTGIVYSTYLGGSGHDYGYGIVVDSDGAAYATGNTTSSDYPAQNAAYATYAGGEFGDAFITKINSSGAALVYSTYLGGSGSDYGYGIAVDSDGAAYVTGNTVSSDFPVQNAIQSNTAGQDDIFITKLRVAYSLTMNAETGGTTDPSPGDHDYYEGTEVIITAIPDTGYGFSHWSEDASGTDNPITTIMDSSKSITANFVQVISSPINFAGRKVSNRTLFLVEYINVLTWQANPDNVNIQKYRIYQEEGDIRSLLVELNADTFEYWHRNVEKDTLYMYALVAVSNEGIEGDPVYVTVQ